MRSASQGGAFYILSIIALYDFDFPGGMSNDNIKWRVVIWGVSEIFLAISAIMNYLPRTHEAYGYFVGFQT